MKRLLFLFLLSFCSLVYSAPQVNVEQAGTVLTPRVTLDSIKVIKSSEDSGDEVYFAITAFHTHGKNFHDVIPNLPVYWPSKALDQINNIPLWQQKIQPGEGVELVVSLIEHDAPPWNIDDLIGTITVKLRNKDGRLEQKWQTPELGEKTFSRRYLKKFELYGENSEYQVTLSLTPNAPIDDKSMK